MSTPTPPPDLVVGDVWTLIPADGLGIGVGSIPTGAQVTVLDVLPPFSVGVAQVDEYTIQAEYTFQDCAYDANGNAIESSNSRIIAYGETVFRSLFSKGAP